MSDKVPVNGVAVVTGGAAGLGAAFVAALLGDGHDVAVLDLAASGTPDTAEPSPAGGRTLTVAGDATDPDALEAFADRVRSELGPPRVLVNNVGFSPYRPFADETLDGWRRVMALNVESTVLATQTFLPDLVSEPDARVVNLSSSVLWDSETRGMVAYTAAKGAVLGLTRALARELGDRDVTVNAIAPGIVRTPDTARVAEETLERYRLRQAVPRIAVPEDLTTALLYLVARGSGQVTGTVLGVNGGRVWV
jgi:NAD(P)-dependent dehydrogenase (short-subunit alcohol dehydrogenase family)